MDTISLVSALLFAAMAVVILFTKPDKLARALHRIFKTGKRYSPGKTKRLLLTLCAIFAALELVCFLNSSHQTVLIVCGAAAFACGIGAVFVLERRCRAKSRGKKGQAHKKQETRTR